MYLLRKTKRLATRITHLHMWIGGLLLTIFVVLFAIEARRTNQARHDELLHDLRSSAWEVKTRLEESIAYLSLFSDENAETAKEVDALREQVGEFMRHHPEVLSMGRIDSGSEPSWSHPPPNEDLLDVFSRSEWAETLPKARLSRHPLLSPAFRMKQGTKALIVFVPMDEGPGLVYFLLSPEILIDTALPDWALQRYEISILDGADQIVARSSTAAQLDPHLGARSEGLTPSLPLRISLQRYQDGFDWQATLLMALSLGVIFGVAFAVRELNADRSKKRELAQQMQKAKELADSANRSKSEFVASVSHELRTPLTAIVGYSDLLIRGLPNPPQLAAHLHTIARNSQHLLLLINDLLDQSKIEAGFLAYAPAPLNLLDLLRELLLSCQSLRRDKDLALIFGTQGQVPTVIMSDGLRLKQILTNLVGNAIKFTEKGEVHLTLQCKRIAAENPPAFLEFHVTDTGIGIPQADQKRIFEAFAQADAGIAQKFGGTGLGLSLSRQMAQLLGGQVYLRRSEPGQGSTFVCQIPLVLPSKDQEWFEAESVTPIPEMTLTPSQTATPISLKGHRILLVEDSHDNQRLIAAYLHNAGATVKAVERGEEALELIQQQTSIDLILMDIQLPGINGYEVTRILRQRGHQIPIIVLTAQTSIGEAERCKTSGAQAYVAKPFDPQLLITTLSRFLPAALPVHEGERDEVIRGPNPVSTDATLTPMLRGFIDRLPTRLSALQTACDQGDWQSLARLAHTLKGTAAIFGHTSLASAAAQLEEASLSTEPQHLSLNAMQTLKDLLETMQRGMDKGGT